MKTIKGFIYILSILFSVGLVSCMNGGLEDLPVYQDAEITAFNFEYRYATSVGGDGEKMQIQELVTDTQIDTDRNIVTCLISVPNPNNTFTEIEKSKVSLKNIVGYASISTAATIYPIDDAPQLGKRNDFSKKTYKYEVIAADGVTRKVWTLIIKDFINN